MGVYSVFVGFVTQLCSPSNVCVWSVDTCVHTELTFRERQPTVILHIAMARCPDRLQACEIAFFENACHSNASPYFIDLPVSSSL